MKTIPKIMVMFKYNTLKEIYLRSLINVIQKNKTIQIIKMNIKIIINLIIIIIIINIKINKNAIIIITNNNFNSNKIKIILKNNPLINSNSSGNKCKKITYKTSKTKFKNKIMFYSEKTESQI